MERAVIHPMTSHTTFQRFPKVIIMTLYSTQNAESRTYTPDELMRLRRERIRDRRRQEASLISTRPDNIVALFPDGMKLAQ